MARAMIGSEVGVSAVDKVDETSLGAITADGVNTFTVSVADARNNFRPGQLIDFVNKTTGAVLAAGRTVNAMDITTGVITYSGADVTTVPGTTQPYLSGQWELAQPAATPVGGREDYANINGGLGVGTGFDNNVFGSIDSMRTRLTAISATTYSAAQLDLMTMNDMIYAIRVNDQLGSIK